MHDVLRKGIKGKDIQETSTLVDTDNIPIENMSLQEVMTTMEPSYHVIEI